MCPFLKLLLSPRLFLPFLLLQAYYEEYHRHVMFVEEYCPSEGLSADTGVCMLRWRQQLLLVLALLHARRACVGAAVMLAVAPRSCG